MHTTLPDMYQGRNVGGCGCIIFCSFCQRYEPIPTSVSPLRRGSHLKGCHLIPDNRGCRRVWSTRPCGTW